MGRLLSNGDELKANFSALDVNAEFSGFQSYIDEAEDLLADVVGFGVVDALADQKETNDPVVKRVVRMISRAAAFLAIHCYSQNALFVFSDKGLYLLKAKDGAIISDKKLKDLQEQCFEAGYKQLDRAIVAMDADLAKFPSYSTSLERETSLQYFIRTAREFTTYQGIGDSHLTYRALLPVMADVEERFLPIYMGEDFYNTYKQAYQDELLSADDKKLLPFIKKSVALLTIADAFNRLPVQMKSTGIYINTYTSTEEYEQRLAPAHEEKDRMKAYFNNLGTDTLLKLRRYLNGNADKYPAYEVPESTSISINSKESGLYGF